MLRIMERESGRQRAFSQIRVDVQNSITCDLVEQEGLNTTAY